ARRHAGRSAQQAHGYDENNRQRQRPALILGRQDQEYEHDRQHEGIEGGIARLKLEQSQLGPLSAHRRCQGRICHFTQLAERLTRADPRPWCAMDRRRRVEVVALDQYGAADFLVLDEARQGYHPPPIAARLEATHITDLLAELRRGLQVYLPGAAETV